MNKVIPAGSSPALRFRRSEEAVLLTILNRQNKTRYTIEQIRFHEPVNVRNSDLVSIRLSVKGLMLPKDHASVKVRRIGLEEILANYPIVVDVDKPDKEKILKALFRQHGMVFHPDRVEVERIDPETPIPLGTLFTREDLNGFYPDDEEFEMEWDDEALPPPAQIWRLTMNEKSLLWKGSVEIRIHPVQELMDRSIDWHLDLSRFLVGHPHSKVPITFLLDQCDAELKYGKWLKRYYAEHRLLLEDELLDEMSRITKDKWVCVDRKERFNLYGAQVLYHGRNRGQWYTGRAEHSHVLILRLSNFCENLYGVMALGYHDPNPKSVDNFRIDREIYDF